jgi:hypothetical protein
MTFSVEPYASGTTHITMSATKAVDLSGVEYYFKNITDTTHSSNWQEDTLFVDTGLEEGKEYSYCVKARDKSANNNETEYSTLFSATTLTSGGEDSCYIEENGVCVMEAENALVSQNGDSSGWSSPFNGPMIWYEDVTESGFVGRAYMTTENGVALNAVWTNSTELAWPVKITNTGEYWIAIRRIAKNGQDNSAYEGVDDIQKGGALFTGESQTFTWERGVSLGNLAAGIRKIQIRRREDGMMIDRVMIANNESKLPANSSSEEGPAESPKGEPVGINEQSDKIIIPEKFMIIAYPNPFNPSTVIHYDLPETSDISIAIYDITGRKIKELLKTRKNAGSHSISWNAKNSFGSPVSSGIYIYRIEAGKFSGVGKLIYLR